MLNLVLFCLFVLFLVAIQLNGGKTVDEVFEKYIRTIGGHEKLGTIKTIYLEGLITMMGNTGLIKIYQLKDDADRESYIFQWQITDLADYQYQTLQSPSNVQLLDAKIIESFTPSTITAYLINYIEDGSKVLLIGKDVVDNVTCYKIELVTCAGVKIIYWFNTDDGLLIKTSFKSDVNNSLKSSVIETKYDKYKTVQGILMAHKIDIIIIGAVASSIEVNFNQLLINGTIKENLINSYNQS